MKKIYVSNAVHPNMNYDRSPKSLIWDRFPRIYRLYLDFLEARPHIRVHVQMPPQTLFSLQQCAPDVVDRFRRLYDAGRITWMGTFYSEPVCLCMDGMSLYESARLGTEITRRELGAAEGFFLQEVIYTPAMPWIVDRLNLGWTIFPRHGEHVLQPVHLDGGAGVRCVGVQIKSFGLKLDLPPLEEIPDESYLLFGNDLEMPGTVALVEDLRERLEGQGCEVEWKLVSEYLRTHEPYGVRSEPPGQGSGAELGLWVSKPIDIVTHHMTLSAMAARRGAELAVLAAGDVASTGSAGAPVPEAPESPDGPETRGAHGIPDTPDLFVRSPITWDVESIATYPGVEQRHVGGPTRSGFDASVRMKHLIAWGTNSDARGHFPLWERTVERREAFTEVCRLADARVRAIMRRASATGDHGRHGYYAVNLFPRMRQISTVVRPDPVELIDSHGANAVRSIRLEQEGYAHQVVLEPDTHSITPLVARGASALAIDRPVAGDVVRSRGIELRAVGGALRITCPSGELTLDQEPFSICVREIDGERRPCRPEGSPRVLVIKGDYPTLSISQQIDWHVHFRADYTTDGDAVFCTWRFEFTSPTLVDSSPELPENRHVRDATPGGILARLTTGIHGGHTAADLPFGSFDYADRDNAFVTALTSVVLQNDERGVLLASQSGSQSFYLSRARGELKIALGRSSNSGPLRKLDFHIGDSVRDVTPEREWYKEPFWGVYEHRFVVRPYAAGSDSVAPLEIGRAYANGVRLVEAHDVAPSTSLSLFSIEPATVVVEGCDASSRCVILRETAGRPTQATLQIGGACVHMSLRAHEIREVEVPIRS